MNQGSFQYSSWGMFGDRWWCVQSNKKHLQSENGRRWLSAWTAFFRIGGTVNLGKNVSANIELQLTRFPPAAFPETQILYFTDFHHLEGQFKSSVWSHAQ